MARWQADHPGLYRWTNVLGLHRVYTHPVFALLLAGAVISLSLSAWSQCAIAWRRTFAGVKAEWTADCFDTSASADDIGDRLARTGYIRLSRGDNFLLMVRHPWGYWGNALLHVGMLVVIGTSLFIALTQQRGLVRMAKGTVQHPDEPILLEEHGMLASPLKLPDAIRLDQLSCSFWPATYGVRSVVSTLSFLSTSAATETKEVAVNSMLSYKGVDYYQATEYGHSFLLDIIDSTGRVERVQLDLQHPRTPEKPSYGAFPDLLGDNHVLRVKYVVNEEMKSFDRADPLLTLRVDSQDHEAGRLSLKEGGEGVVESFRFHLVSIAPWSQFVVVHMAGMPIIFAGFFVICLGGLLHYFTPPREIVIRTNPGGDRTVCWRGIRFAGLYREEYDQLKKMLIQHRV